MSICIRCHGKGYTEVRADGSHTRCWNCQGSGKDTWELFMDTLKSLKKNYEPNDRLPNQNCKIAL